MKVGIVGAGITGLALTHYLADRGIESVTFEAESEPGGVIDSRTVDGRVLEAGPQRMRKTPDIAELAGIAGVEDAFIEAGEETLFVYADGRLREVPFSKRTFLETDLLSWRGKARLLAEPLTRDGMQEETAEQLFVRKFGREAYERFIGPLFGGIYGSDPAEMPAAYALDSLLEREQDAGNFLQAFRSRIGDGQQPPAVSFEEGLQQLPEALCRTYTDRIELDTPVTGIESLRKDGSFYALDTPAGTYEVDNVVLTTPAAVTADLLGDILDGTRALQELRYNRLAVVFLHAQCDRDGYGYQVAFGEDLRTLGVSWNASMFGRDGVYTVYLGGMHDPGLMSESDERLGQVAASEFETAMGESASVIDVVRLDPGFPAWDHTWWNLQSIETPDGIDLATNYTSRMGVPSRVGEAKALAEELGGDTASGRRQTPKQ